MCSKEIGLRAQISTIDHHKGGGEERRGDVRYLIKQSTYCKASNVIYTLLDEVGVHEIRTK